MLLLKPKREKNASTLKEIILLWLENAVIKIPTSFVCLMLIR